MQNFDIHRAGGGAPDLPRNIPADFSHSLFNSIFPYSGDILFAQLHPGRTYKINCVIDNAIVSYFSMTISNTTFIGTILKLIY